MSQSEFREIVNVAIVFAIVMAICLLTSMLLGDELSEVRRIAPKYSAAVEVRQWDDTRIDMLTDTHAIEVDWSEKWAEAVGQSLYYAAVSGRKPGICLLVRDREKESRHIFRCQTVCVRHGIWLFLEPVSEK